MVLIQAFVVKSIFITESPLELSNYNLAENIFNKYKVNNETRHLRFPYLRYQMICLLIKGNSNVAL